MLKARAQLTVKTAKQFSWNKYVSEINSNTPLSDVWNKVRKISGLHTSYNFTGLKENNNFITSSSDIANIFGRIYQGHSSNQQYTANFLKAKEFAEQNPIYLFEAQNNSLNHPITFQEINSSILNLKDSSPGPDDIPSAFLKHLPVSAITYLLNIFNRIWLHHQWPAIWSNAIVIPFLKTNKPKYDPESYRPISLTSTTCKLLENIVNSRLMGFRKF
ncbi:uncharacterized protein [Diabrotica undecimpunctata]|uniref:uncharacterized protein n=1 Tax=Diabrotica undecimpunctata TaxID=50387 RepID=UPI003B63A1BE